MGNKKVNRKRKYPCQFYVDEEELAMIKYKMTKAGIKNQSEYFREMSVYGKVVKFDLSELRPICNELNRIGVNLNQVARIANTTGAIYRNDLADLMDKFNAIYESVDLLVDNTEKNMELLKKQPFETIQEKVKREMNEQKK